MSELILLRNKIKTIQTIQKMTHTMRLIAMSGHTALKKKESNTSNYIKEISRALQSVSRLIAHQEGKKPFESPQKILCIIIGSQKGLCGSFNTQLEPVFYQYLQKKENADFSLALIGGQVIKNKVFKTGQDIVYQEAKLTQKTSSMILHELKELIAQYDHISIISNHFRSFFLQEAAITQVFPLNHTEKEITNEDTVPFLCDENMQDIYESLLTKYRNALLSFLLYQSLLAEHAARFSSMDAANRNANSMLDETRIKYNKLRQAKITTEINELSANFS